MQIDYPSPSVAVVSARAVGGLLIGFDYAYTLEQ
jgi:hypothetical protein